MFVMNDDLSIYANRGDIVFFSVTADDNGVLYKFQPGDIVRMAIYGKKEAETCVMQKDFPITEVTEKVFIFLDEQDTKIGDIISKHKDYWYEIVLNPDTMPQTIIGYDEDGAKVFRLFPESHEIDDNYDPQPEDFPVVDEELDMTSPRPVANSAIARAVATILDTCERTNKAVAENFVSPEMYGAIGDGVADDTEAIQAALDSGNPLVFKERTYAVKTNRYDGLVVPTGTRMTGNNTVFKAINENAAISNVLNLSSVKDVFIKGFVIIGDVNENTQRTNTAGHGISINGCENVHIDDVICRDCLTDGIYIRGNNIKVSNSTMEHNGRQGISITNGTNIIIENVECNGSFLFSPMSGIDIEPSLETDVVDNITLRNVQTAGNSGKGLTISLAHMKNREHCDIVVDNYCDIGSGGVEIGEHHPNVKMAGAITMSNVTLIDSEIQGISIRGRDKTKCVTVLLDGVKIINPNTKKEASTYGCGIYFYAGTEAVPSGNVFVSNLLFASHDNINGRFIYGSSYIEDVTVINCPDLKNDITWYEVIGECPNAAREIVSSGTYSLVNTMTVIRNTSEADVVFRVPSYVTNKSITVIHDSNKWLSVDFKVPVLGLSGTGKVQTEDKGSSLTLKLINKAYYILVSKTGDWTAI